MKTNRLAIALVALAIGQSVYAQKDSIALKEVVVTGTRNAVDVRHLPITVSVVGRETLTEQHQASVLPTVMQQVPLTLCDQPLDDGLWRVNGCCRRH